MILLHNVFLLLHWLLNAVSFCIIAAAIASWLVAFNIVNPRNGFVYQVLRFLDAVTAPVLAPLRKVIPLLGGVDITPLVALLAISYLAHPAVDLVANLVGA